MATPAVHKQLADWYRIGGIEPDAAILPKRWKGVSDFEAESAGVVQLTRLFYGLGETSRKFIDAFRASLQKADQAVPMRGNEHEIRILAGAALVDIIERADPEFGDFAALSLVAASGQNLRQTPPVPEIPELAVAYLASRSAEREPADQNDHVQSDPGLSEALSTAAATNAPANLATPLQKLAVEVGRLFDAVAGLRRKTRLQSEETNMLWWLFSGYSRDLKQSLSDLPQVSGCILAGKELGDLTTILPGPAAALAFLDRSIAACKDRLEQISLGEAINAVPSSWRTDTIKTLWSDALSDLMPVTTGMKISLTVPPGNDWAPAFKHATGIDANATLAPTSLAYQTYLEVLLSRAHAQTE